MKKSTYHLLSGILLILVGVLEATKDARPLIGLLLIVIGGKDLIAWRHMRREGASAAATELDLDGFSPEEALAASALYDRALTDYNAIETARAGLRDAELAATLARVQDKADTMLAYIEAHPQTINSARKYIETYQSRAAQLATEFVELERSRLTTERIETLKERLKTTLADFELAYAVEYEKIISNSLLSTEAELDVVEQVMEADGVQERGRASSAHTEAPSYTAQPRGTGFFARLRERAEAIFAREQSYYTVPMRSRTHVITHKITAGLLGIVLGSIGAHKFFRGRALQGVFYILFCWTFIPGLVGFIEGVRYLFMPLDDYYTKIYDKDRKAR